ncbi:hypothetical protein B296_00042221 [Ensete ventricosum]|uniref:Uncharacterized protein n=1 Tax=Ensete ventricosum TaxID=4639 RepID=A0A426Y3J1_ENSVE|nr:hypothetical protein B296_00042221 [Ensete ventricosum]
MYHCGRSQIASTSESHGGDLIIQRYDRSDWRVGLLQYLYSLKGARCLENIEVLNQVVERGEEATTSPEGLSDPKVKHRLKRRWTRKSAIVLLRHIYRSQRRDADTRQRIVGPWVTNAMFDYSTATKSSWELRGVLQPKQKIENLAKCKEM